MSNVQAPKRGGIVVPHKPSFRQWLGSWIVFVFLKLMSATVRYRWIDRSGHFDAPPAKPVIMAAWHNRLALILHVYFSYMKKRNQSAGLVALISASRDGGFLAGIFARFGVATARGSSSRRGPQALRELTTFAKKGYDLGLTPDGPRGPCYVAQDGVIYLAQLTGLPILPVSYHLQWKLRVKSWDRFQIPLPFSRCEVYFARPVYVPRETTPEQREAFRKQLEKTLKEISRD
jgi:lysophospholipid acyltransferase (LPLAT)-like uncharacterized protein